MKEENELKAQEMERLKHRVSIMTEIKGVSANELRNALQAICAKEANTLESSSCIGLSTTMSGNDSARSNEKHPPVGEVLDHWLQELSAEEQKQRDQEKSRKGEAQELSHCSTPSLSPPRIIKTNDGIENWPIDDKDTPTSIMEAGGLTVRSLTRNILGSDPAENLNEWCDELLEETALTYSRTKPTLKKTDCMSMANSAPQAASPISVVRHEIDEAEVKVKVGGKVSRAPEVIKQSVSSSLEEDDSCDSVVGLEIKTDPQGEVNSSEEEANYRHRFRLREIMERRKQAGSLLTSDRVLESLLKSRQSSGRPGSRDISEFDCNWDKASSCMDNEGAVPQMWQHIPPPPPPPLLVRKPSGLKSVTRPFEDFILSSSIDDGIGELMGEACDISEIDQSVKPRKPGSSRSVKISVHGNDDIRMENRKADRTPSESAGCLGKCPVELMACGDSLKDTTKACVDKVREAHETVSFKMLGTNDSTKTVSEDDGAFAPGLVGFVDQLAADLDKTISGFSEFIQSISESGVAAIEQAVDTPLCGMQPEDEEEADSLFDGTRRQRSSSSKAARRNRKGKKPRGRRKKTCCGLYARRSVYI